MPTSDILSVLGLRSDDPLVVDPRTGRITIPAVLPNGKTIDQLVLEQFPHIAGLGGGSSDPALAEALGHFIAYGDNNLQQLVLGSQNPIVRQIGEQLVTNATLQDQFSFFGDNLLPALALLGAGVGAAALTAPAAATTAGAGAAAAGAGGGAGIGATAPSVLGSGAVLGGGTLAASGAAGGAGAGAGATLAGIPISSLIGPAVTAGTSIAGGLIGAGAASDAADAQTKAAQNSNQLLRDIYAQQFAQQEPFLRAGAAALPELVGLATGPAQQTPPYTVAAPLDPGAYPLEAFAPPTADTLSQDPGYQFRLREGQRALESSAAARGGLLSGGFARSLTRYAQDAASQEFQNAYGRAAQQYQFGLQRNQVGYERANAQNQQTYQREQDRFRTNYDIQNQQQTQRFNRLASLAGLGQTQAGQLGQAASNYGNQAAQTLQGIGNVQAANQIAQGNALSGAISGIAGGVNQYFNQQQQADQQYQLLAALAAQRR